MHIGLPTPPGSTSVVRACKAQLKLLGFPFPKPLGLRPASRHCMLLSSWQERWPVTNTGTIVSGSRLCCCVILPGPVGTLPFVRHGLLQRPHAANLCDAGVTPTVHSYWGLTLYHPEDLPWDAFKRAGSRPDPAKPMNCQPANLATLPDVMTQYRKPTQSQSEVRLPWCFQVTPSCLATLPRPDAVD